MKTTLYGHNRAYLFDVDGTLTPPRQSMDKEFAGLFREWATQNVFYIVSGSDLDKICEQVPQDILNLARGIFCCMGNQLFLAGGAQEVYCDPFEPSEELLEVLERFMEKSDYPHPHRTGNHIERRPGMVNFSVVGRNATLDDRRRYAFFDHKTRERETLRGIIINKFPHLDVSIGGEISIDIYPRGNDKSRAVRWILNNHPPEYIIFMGDKVRPGGNDFAAAKEIESSRGVWFDVEDWKETRAILKINNLYTNKDGENT